MSLSNCLSTSSLPHHFSSLKFIWISHAHLDHYGGLPSLLHTLYHTATVYGKRKPPIVIAPNKVLRYLNLILNSKGYATTINRKQQQYREYSNGDVTRSKKVQNQYCIGVTHDEFRYEASHQCLRNEIMNNPFPPISHLQSMPVQHCVDSHALLIGLSNINKNKQQQHHEQHQPCFVCYSGGAKTPNSYHLTNACKKSVCLY